MKTLEARDARIFQLEQKNTTDAPKVSYVDTYVTDADLLSFSTVASTNGVTEKWLRQLLIEKDWIYCQSDSRWSEKEQKKVTRNRYSEKSDKKRYFRRVEVHEAPRFRGSEVMHTLKITPQGAEAIARLVAKEQAA
nr:phage antirepressor KilAC domain-containing protein [Mycolicibacterium fluoranthenivorans]